MAHSFCGCGRCTVGAITGPLMLIAAGVLFAVDQAGSYSIRQTWPVLLILYGVSKALAAIVPAHGGR